jgi:tetratricopeptide (TPR) repeat protein
MVNRIPLALCVATSLLVACEAQHKRLVIPDEMLGLSQPVRPPAPPVAAHPDAATKPPPGAAAKPTPSAAAQPTPAAAAQPALAASRTGNVVLRLAEHGRSWEVELPETSGGYELRLPLGDAAPIEKPTAADQELWAAGARKADPAGKDLPDAKRISANVPHARSYLGSLARVTEMFSSKRYELALIEVVNLEAEYPEDERILAMKGTLLFKLGKPTLAREAWQKAAAIDPQDATVQEALRELGNTEEAQ